MSRYNLAFLSKLLVAVGLVVFGWILLSWQPKKVVSATLALSVHAEATPYEYKIGLNTPPTTLDPQQTNDDSLVFATFHLYDTLLLVDTTGHYTSSLALAESIQQTADGTSYIFQLRPDLQFHNNEPFTAASVRSSWEYRQKTFNDPWNLVSDVQVLDDHTVQITPASTLSQQDFLNLVVPGLIIEHPNSTPEQPIGTGPYQLASWVISNTIQMVQNPHYQGPKETFGIERVLFRYIVPTDTAPSVDVIFGATITQSHFLEQQGFTQFSKRATAIYTLYNPQLTGLEPVPALWEEVNTALQWSIDPTKFSNPKLNPAIVNQLNSPMFDRRDARYVLEATGLRNNLEVKLYSQALPITPLLGDVQAQWEHIGINATLSNEPFTPDLVGGEYPVIVERTVVEPDLPIFTDQNPERPLNDGDNWIFKFPLLENIITNIRPDVPEFDALQRWVDDCRECAGTEGTSTSTPKGYTPVALSSGVAIESSTPSSGCKYYYWVKPKKGKPYKVCVP